MLGNPRLLAASSGSSGGEQRSVEAFGWGLLSASSLVIGSSIGIWRLPSKVVRAALMAFGGGALIQALSIELFAHIIDTARGAGHGAGHCDPQAAHAESTIDRALIGLAIGSAVVGGLIFAALDRVLSNHGAFLRKAATVHSYVGQLRYALMRRLIKRLQQVPMFEVLPAHQLQRLARSMTKERYAAGSVIFRELGSDSSIFFLLSGRVELTVTTRYAKAKHGHAAHIDNGQQHDADGADEVVDKFRLGPNDIFGEMSLFTGETMQAQAMATTRCCTLRIPRVAIHRLLANNRRLQDFVAMTAIDKLRETEVFHRCTPSTVARLVHFMRQAEFEAGDILFYDVDAFCPIYFIVLGCVQVKHGATSFHPDHMIPETEQIVHANELLGTEHLVYGHAVHMTAVALEQTTVLIIQRRDIDKLCEKDERFRQALVTSTLSKTGSKQDISLDPPEGVEPPMRFGETLIEDLGWKREVTPGPSGQPMPEVLQERMEGEHTPGKDSEKVVVPKQVATPVVSEPGGESDDEDRDGELLAENDLPDLLENADAAAGEGHGAQGHGGGRGVQGAIMIWLGILIDGVPESVVMGILVNTASSGTLIAFVCGVFLANFPEAMSSAGTMRAHGMRRGVILVMWTSIALMTGLGAFVGAILFPPGSSEDPFVQKVIAAIEGLCGGAMLCMIANTVLPEAFEQGGNVTGLSTLLGFLVAIAISCAQ